jgi:hypothetical protein
MAAALYTAIGLASFAILYVNLFRYVIFANGMENNLTRAS